MKKNPPDDIAIHTQTERTDPMIHVVLCVRVSIIFLQNFFVLLGILCGLILSEIIYISEFFLVSFSLTN